MKRAGACAGLLVALIVLTAGCSQAESGAPSPATSTAAEPAGSGTAATGASSGTGTSSDVATSSPTQSSDFARFEQQCQDATSSFMNGRAAWTPDAAMTVGTGTQVSVDITLDPNAAASAQIPQGPATSEPILLTCNVQAEIGDYDHDDFTVEAGQPDVAQQILPSGRAHWNWTVTPTKAVITSLYFVLRPVVLVAGGSANPTPAGQVLSLPCRVTATENVSLSTRITSGTDSATSVVSSLTKLITAVTALLAALAGLWGWRRHRKKKTNDSTGTQNDTPDPSPAGREGVHSPPDRSP